jgi:hypothetical protein
MRLLLLFLSLLFVGCASNSSPRIDYTGTYTGNLILRGQTSVDITMEISPSMRFEMTNDAGKRLFYGECARTEPEGLYCFQALGLELFTLEGVMVDGVLQGVFEVISVSENVKGSFTFEKL